MKTFVKKKYNIKNYHINGDGTVDVHGDVNLRSRGLDKIPLKFSEVSGHFDCEWNNLTNLVGCPKRVGVYFCCDCNKKLTSLEGCPTYIGRYFWCQWNKNLWSFDYFPRHAKMVWLGETPIEPIFDLFKDVYEADGGKFFSTSGTLIDYFQDCDPVYPGKVIKKRRMNNFLASIGKELTSRNIDILRRVGWKIED